ncbi:amino acid adenylation domain-containing protein [Streptomyces sp. NPDC054784]
MSTPARLFADQAARTPRAVALVSDAGTVDYATLHARVCGVAGALRRAGVGPGSLVAVRMDRSPDLVTALLGVLTAGAAYLPLDAGTPPRRAGTILEEAAPRLVLDALPAPGPPGDVRAAAADPGCGAGPGDTAYVIYTSGSTGRPKGVVVRQEAIAGHLGWMGRAFPLAADDRVLMKTPIGFDVSVYEWLWPLLSGAAVVVSAPGLEREPHRLADVVERHAVTTAQFVPSMLHLFLDADVAARCRTLRRVVCIGEALPVSVRDRCLRLLDAELHNLYGPTEATVAATAWHCLPGRDPETVPIGRPVDGTGAHVLDAELREPPVGEVGELYLSGTQLAEGYLARPGLTAERFVANPLGPPGSRLYRTGDLARRRTDGAVEFLGRVDGQVKFRGRRIELGEIESVLCTHPAVAQAAVVLADPPGRDPWLAGHVVPAAGGGPLPSWDELAAFLTEALPAHMVPAAWAVLDRVPLTGNGKLDRQALPAPPAPGRVGAAPTPPGSPTGAAAALCSLVEDVLLLPPGDAAPRHSFVGLGGDSVSAMRLVTRLRQRGTAVTVADVIGAATLAELAEQAEPAPSPAPRPGTPAAPGPHRAAPEERPEPELLPDLDPHEYEALAAQLRGP